MENKLYYYNDGETESRQFVPLVVQGYLKEVSNSFTYFIT